MNFASTEGIYETIITIVVTASSAPQPTSLFVFGERFVKAVGPSGTERDYSNDGFNTAVIGMQMLIEGIEQAYKALSV